MVWFKVDDKLPTSPKVMAIPRPLRLPCVGLWTTAGAWSAGHLQDGYVPAFMVDEWCGTQDYADQLVSVGLWKKHRDGYKFHDWDVYNPTREAVEKKRADDAARKAAARAKRAANAGNTQESPRGHETDSVRTPSGTPQGFQAESALPDPTRPDPTRPDPVTRDTSNEVSLLSPGKPDDAGTLIPDEWRPNQKHIDLASSLHLDVVGEYQRFRNHAQRERRRLKNWNSGFTNWLRKGAEYAQKNAGAPRNRAVERQEANLAVVASLAALDAAQKRGITR